MYAKYVSCSVPKERTKVILVGTSGSGKTSLVSRLRGYEVPYDHFPTLGCEVRPVDILIHRGVVKKMEIWDCSGEEALGGFADEEYFENADAAIIMYDTTESDIRYNLESVRKLKDKVRKTAGDVPIVVVGNKGEFKHSTRLAGSHIISVDTGAGILIPFLDLFRKLSFQKKGTQYF